jgi:hypothetical protein
MMTAHRFRAKDGTKSIIINEKMGNDIVLAESYEIMNGKEAFKDRTNYQS